MSTAIINCEVHQPFLGATNRLYNWLCPSVGRLVGNAILLQFLHDLTFTTTYKTTLSVHSPFHKAFFRIPLVHPKFFKVFFHNSLHLLSSHLTLFLSVFLSYLSTNSFHTFKWLVFGVAVSTCRFTAFPLAVFAQGCQFQSNDFLTARCFFRMPVFSIVILDLFYANVDLSLLSATFSLK